MANMKLYHFREGGQEIGGKGGGRRRTGNTQVCKPQLHKVTFQRLITCFIPQHFFFLASLQALHALLFW